MAGPITRAPRGGEDTRLLNSAKIYRFLLLSCPKRRLEPSLSAHGVSSRRSETDGGLTCLEFRPENKSRQPTPRPERSRCSRLIELHSSQCYRCTGEAHDGFVFRLHVENCLR